MLIFQIGVNYFRKFDEKLYANKDMPILWLEHVWYTIH